MSMSHQHSDACCRYRLPIGQIVTANLNIEAAVASVFTKGGAGRSGQEWPVEMYPSDIARAVAAALTPGDTQVGLGGERMDYGPQESGDPKQ